MGTIETRLKVDYENAVFEENQYEAQIKRIAALEAKVKVLEDYLKGAQVCEQCLDKAVEKV